MRAGNYGLLHQNSLIALIDRPLEELSCHGRPLSLRDGVERIARERAPRYRAWADLTVSSTDSARHTAQALAVQLPEML